MGVETFASSNYDKVVRNHEAQMKLGTFLFNFHCRVVVFHNFRPFDMKGKQFGPIGAPGKG